MGNNFFKFQFKALPPLLASLLCHWQRDNSCLEIWSIHPDSPRALKRNGFIITLLNWFVLNFIILILIFLRGGDLWMVFSSPELETHAREFFWITCCLSIRPFVSTFLHYLTSSSDFNKNWLKTWVHSRGEFKIVQMKGYALFLR